jgi:hypothetical protein
MERVPEPDADDERGVLLGWLAFHRDALRAKCAGLSSEQLVVASAPPSPLTLLGLVRHLSEMEYHYLLRSLGGPADGPLYCTDDEPDADFLGLGPEQVDASLARWRELVTEVDALLVGRSLDDRTVSGRRTVRWCVAKVVQEYARHNGHADLVRERIDGAVGE